MGLNYRCSRQVGKKLEQGVMGGLSIDIVMPNGSVDMNGQTEYVIRTPHSGQILILESLLKVIKKS